MGSKKIQIPPEFAAAPREQQIEFVNELWDQIALDPASIPIPESHKLVLKERLDALRANPQDGKSWEEVREELLDKFREN